MTSSSAALLRLLFAAGLVAVAATARPREASAGAAEHTIKFATLAPEGSTWMKRLREMDQAVRARTAGRLAFKFYAGGVAGDERDVVRKMRSGQISGGGFTGLGLGEMASEARVVELPLLTRDEATAERVAAGLTGEIAGAMQKRGFVHVAWAHPGFAYFLTRPRVASLDELKRLKVWTWEGDPVASALFEALGLAPVPLALPDVLPSLQTGLVDGCYATPLGAIALQWHTRVKYVLQLPVAFVSGAIVVSSSAWDKLPEDLRTAVREEAAKASAALAADTRRETSSSWAALRAAGIESVAPPESERAAFERAAAVTREKLRGTLFPAPLVDRAVALAAGK